MTIKLESKIVRASEHVGEDPTVPRMIGSSAEMPQEALWFNTLQIYQLGRRLAREPNNPARREEYVEAQIQYMSDYSLAFEPMIENLYRVKQHSVRMQRERRGRKDN